MNPRRHEPLPFFRLNRETSEGTRAPWPGLLRRSRGVPRFAFCLGKTPQGAAQDPLPSDDTVGFEAYCSTRDPLLKSLSRLSALHFMPLPLSLKKEKSHVPSFIAAD